MSDITKRAMGRSLKRLMNSRDFDKITVTDIVRDCCVNRQTFYYHFRDIYDLLEWIYLDEVIFKIERDTNYSNWQDNFLYLFGYMQDNKRFVMNTYKSVDRSIILNFIFKNYNVIFIKIVDDLSREYQVRDEDKTFIANFYKYGFTGVIEEWVINGMRYDPEVLLEKLEKMLCGSFVGAIKNMASS